MRVTYTRVTGPTSYPVSVPEVAAFLRLDETQHALVEGLIATAAEYLDGRTGVMGGLTLITHQGNAAFFRLADSNLLANETRDYVPKLIAAAIIAKQPARFGIQTVPVGDTSECAWRANSSLAATYARQSSSTHRTRAWKP